MSQAWNEFVERHHHEEAALEVLARHPEIADTTTGEGATCFALALRNGSYALVKRMLELGAELYPSPSVSASYTDALHSTFGSDYANPEALRALLEQRRQPIDINRPDKEGYSALARAVDRMTLEYTPEEQQKRVECCRLLAAAGGDVNVVTEGHSLLHVICASTPEAHPDVMRILATQAYDVTSCYEGPRARRLPPRTTPFLAALNFHPPAALQAMIEGGVDPLATNGLGQNAFSLDLFDMRPVDQQRSLGNRDWLKGFITQTRAAVEGEKALPLHELAERYLAHTPAARAWLHTVLGTDSCNALFAAEDWEKRGGAGAKAGMAFAQKLRDALSPHRQHLLIRIDDIPLRRDGALPGEQAAIASYAHGATTLTR